MTGWADDDGGGEADDGEGRQSKPERGDDAASSLGEFARGLDGELESAISATRPLMTVYQSRMPGWIPGCQFVHKGRKK